MSALFLLRTTALAGLIAILFTAHTPSGVANPILARWRSDANYYYLESNGMPTHKMMVAITASQQQVPLPQDFTGGNAFRIPRNPVFADKPILAKNALFSGAIAVAINGVPIFNPIKNDGVTDTFLAGELDDFGGHCGRADDYHYHIAPLHLVDTVGAANPIGYALDGFPLYGIAEIDGTTVTGLDAYNGHTYKGGSYHYHATKAYPYVNGGLRGVVEVRNDAIYPQPVTAPVRPAGDPLRGARIVGFTWPAPNRYSLEYSLNGERYFLNSSLGDGTYTFEAVDPAGRATTQTYNRPAPWPNLYSTNSTGLATGYLTRVSNGQQTSEQFVRLNAGQAAALPIDLGPATDRVFLILYGSNLGAAATGTATVNGVTAPLLYAAPLSPFNGVAQYNIEIPRSLAGAGKVDVAVTLNNRTSNPVNVTIR
ncbi:MAG: YHYH protein [Acidobacteriota bacterium]